MQRLLSASPIRSSGFWRELPPEDSLGDPTIDHGNDQVAGADSRWIISHGVTRLLYRATLMPGVMSVLEFGAGRSSEVIADALARKGTGRLTTVEHEPRFAKKSWARISNCPVDARLLESRLGYRLTRFGLLAGYLDIRSGLASRSPYDLVFIDAPPGHFGRDATLYDALPFLSTGALVILDDAARANEQTTIRRWLRHIPGLRLLVFDPAFERGVAVFRVDRTDVRFSWRSFAGSVGDRLLRSPYRRSPNQGSGEPD